MIANNAKRPFALLLILLMAVALVAGSTTAAPQGARRDRVRAARVKRQYAQIMARLNLTQQQRDRIKAVKDDARKKAQDIRHSNLSAEQKRLQLAELRENTHKRVLNVLTPEQREKVRRVWQSGLRDGRRIGRRLGQQDLQFRQMQRCLAKLDLSSDQKQKIAAIHQRAMEAVRDVRTNRELSDRAKRDRIAIIRERTHEQVMSVLTPEQRQIFRQECGQMLNLRRK